MSLNSFCGPRSPHADDPLLKGNGAEIRHLMLILLQLWQRHMSADAECDRHVESAQTFVHFFATCTHVRARACVRTCVHALLAMLTFLRCSYCSMFRCFDESMFRFSSLAMFVDSCFRCFVFRCFTASNLLFKMLCMRSQWLCCAVVCANNTSYDDDQSSYELVQQCSQGQISAALIEVVRAFFV